MKHLWETDHPYYANEGNYFKNGLHETFATWADFIEVEGGFDIDLNLVYRWDWKVPDPTDYFEEEEVPTDEVLFVYFIGQRKALCRSAQVVVTRDQEDAVREFLLPRAERIRDIWEPLLDLDKDNA